MIDILKSFRKETVWGLKSKIDDIEASDLRIEADAAALECWMEMLD